MPSCCTQNEDVQSSDDHPSLLPHTLPDQRTCPGGVSSLNALPHITRQSPALRALVSCCPSLDATSTLEPDTLLIVMGSASAACVYVANSNGSFADSHIEELRQGNGAGHGHYCNMHETGETLIVEFCIYA